MSGTSRLPSGEPRKASQRRARRGEQVPARISRIWRAGDHVRWRDRSGVYKREAGDGEHAEIVIADRVYRVRAADLA